MGRIRRQQEGKPSPSTVKAPLSTIFPVLGRLPIGEDENSRVRITATAVTSLYAKLADIQSNAIG
ncbi:MAG TPA: hypothetical protein PLD66_03310 [Accumulibacter sp.]|nr:hypothetical protein [Accumulibacter sp.]